MTLKLVKWQLVERRIYKPRSGITINAAESFNAVLKRFLERNEVQAQVLILSIYQIDRYYNNEIARGLCGVENYSLKSDCKRFAMNSTTFDKVLHVHLDLDKLPYIFKNRDFKQAKTGKDGLFALQSSQDISTARKNSTYF